MNYKSDIGLRLNILSWLYISVLNGYVSGFSKSVAVCVKKGDKGVVKNNFCVPHLKPNDRVKYCNEEPCPPEYEHLEIDYD